MFFTRPKIPALGLDLVEISGGGSCPAQFNGITMDGRDVYIRYRGGLFSVEVSDPTADRWSFPSQMRIEAQIGPALHGEMLLEQACDLAGLTVLGEKLVLTEEKRRQEAEKGPILDWSGRVTYWRSNLQVSETGGRQFVECLKGYFPDLQILTLSLERGTWRRRCEQHESMPANADSVLLGIGGNPSRVAALRMAEHVRLADLEDAFDHLISFRFDWNSPRLPNVKTMAETSSEELKRPITVAEGLKGSLQTQFRSEDPAGRKFIDTFVSAVDSCFSESYKAVDLRTGEIVNGYTDKVLRSNDLKTWGDGQTDHYLAVYRDGMHKGARLLGIKAVTEMKLEGAFENE